MLHLPSWQFIWNSVALISLVPVLVLFIQRFLRKPNYMNLPPGPPAWPVFGNRLFPDPSQRLSDWSKQYGDTILIQLGSRKMVVMHDVSIVRSVFMSDATTGRDQKHLLNVLSQGKGIQQAEGELWREQRRFMTRALRDQGMGKTWLEDSILAETEILLKKIIATNCQPIDPKPMLAHTVANIVSAMATGRRYSHVDLQFRAFANVFAKVLGCLESLGLVSRFRWLRFLPTFARTWATYLAGWQVEIDFCKKQIEEQKLLLKEQFGDEGGYVSAFLEKAAIDRAKNLPSSSFNYDQLLFSLVNLYSGGTETTTSTMLWGFLYMATYPDIQRKVQSEIDKVIPGNTPVRLENKTDLSFTEATLLEIQRNGSVAPLGLHHVALEEVEVDGYKLPKDTLLMVNIGAIHHDARYWKYPDKFFPKHFLSETGEVISPQPFIPFGVGKRMCPGAPLARMTLYLMFANILKNFNIITNNPEVSPKNFISNIIRGPKPYMIQFFPRQPKSSISEPS